MRSDHFDVFLSYHWRDHAQVEALARRLREQDLTVFLDRWYLAPGQSWPKALEASLARCGAVAVCIGQGEMGPWQQREQYLALERQVSADRQGQRFPVIPVLLPGAEPPLGFLSQNTWIDFRTRSDDPVLLHTLVKAIQGEPPGPDAQGTVQETLATICPYRGLLYFREEDAPFFFGREEATIQLVRAVEQHTLIAVVGASGSGKSSVVRAGLVPALRKSTLRVWEIATIVPTDRPIHALAAVVMPLLEPDMSEIDRLIETNKLADALLQKDVMLRDVVDRALAKQPGTDRLFLIVDQWEELFTLCQDDQARRCFIDNVLESTATAKLSVVLTLRGDFFGRAIAAYRPLSDRVQGAQVNLGPMLWEELRLAIEEPAKKVGLTFEPGLVHLMLEQAGDEPGHLPLLEFVLRQLWEQRCGGELHHEAYNAMGQLEGAIAKKAESIYMALSSQDQQRVQQIFLRLVRPGEGEADTRRRAGMEEMSEEVRSLVNRLADERLLVTSLASGVEETIEVSHEALIRNWDRFRQWVNEDREFLLWRERIEHVAQEWEKTGYDWGILLRGAHLSEAERWISLKGTEVSDGGHRFIQESLRLKECESRLDELRHKKGKLVSFSSGFAALLLVTAPTTGNPFIAKGIDWLFFPPILVLLYFLTNIIVQRTVRVIAALPNIYPDGQPLEKKIGPTSFLVRGLLAQRGTSGSFLGFIKAHTFAFSIWWLTPLTLAIMWITYLPRREWWGTTLHISLMLITILWGLWSRRRTLAILGLQRRRLYGIKDLALVSMLITLSCVISFYAINRRAWLGKVTLTGSGLANQDLSRFDLVDANLRSAYLGGTNLKGAMLNRADLSMAGLANANLIGANLEGANLRRAFLQSARLTGVNAKSAKFQDAVLDSAHLEEAVLVDANMEEAIMSGANLRAANLEMADLRRASLQGAYLQYANLTRAALDQANLQGANLQNATVTQRQIDAACGDDKTIVPVGMKRPVLCAGVEATNLARLAEEATDDRTQDSLSSKSGGVLTLALIHAVQAGYLRATERFLQAGAEIEGESGGNMTPLMVAARKGDLKLVEVLLDRGANMEARGKFEWTPLMWAIASGNADVVGLLIKRGADVKHVTPEGETAISLAERYGKLEVIEVLRSMD
jgi:uncharacterized protein YjbI with pentapeptide repeats